jgi:hypothetical protein
MLFRRLHLSEGLCLALWKEYGVEAEAAFTAHWPDNAALDRPFEDSVFPIRPGNAQRADEACGSWLGRGLLLEQMPYLVHRHRKVAAIWRLGPIGGVHTGLAAKRVYHDPAVIGKRRHPAFLCGSVRLDPRVPRKRRLRFGGFREIQLRSRHDLDAERLKQDTDLAHLAGVVRGDDELLYGQIENRQVTAAY